jgi:predicted phage tail protein
MSVERTLRLYGPLADRTGYTVLTANIRSVGEAVRFLVANWPEMEALIASYDWQIFSGLCNLGADEILHPLGSSEDIHLIPIISGSGAAGLRIVGGILLVAASFAVPGVALAGLALGPVMFGAGISLVLGGVSQLLAPTVATAAKARDPKEVNSYSISGVQLTSRQGLPVNVPYGEIVMGAIVISAGVTTAELPGTKSGDRSITIGEAIAATGKR